MFVSRRIVKPFVGKSGLVVERAKKVSAIMQSHGAKTRVAQVYAGEGAGDIHLYGFFDTLSAGTKAATGMLEDKTLADLFDERAKAPGGDMTGPDVFRSVYGSISGVKKAALQRIYEMDRRNLKAAVELLGEVSEIFSGENVDINAVVPIFSGKMDALVVTYFFEDLVALGDAVDRIGMSEAFQAIVERSHELGRLFESRTTILLD